MQSGYQAVYGGGVNVQFPAQIANPPFRAAGAEGFKDKQGFGCGLAGLVLQGISLHKKPCCFYYRYAVPIFIL
jgi:hypothetical protein